MAANYNKVQVMYTRWRRVHQCDKNGQAIPHQHDTGFMKDCKSDLQRLKTVLGGAYHFSSTDYKIRRQRNTLGKKMTPTSAQVTDSIAKLAAGMDRDDLFVFYYVGHGGRAPGGKLLLSGNKYDIEYDDIDKTLMSLPCDVLVIMDCCHATNVKGPATSNKLLPPPSNAGRPKKLNFLGACMAYDSTTGNPQCTMTSLLTAALMEVKDQPSTVFRITGEMDEKTKSVRMTGNGVGGVHYAPLETEGGDITLAPI